MDFLVNSSKLYVSQKHNDWKERVKCLKQLMQGFFDEENKDMLLDDFWGSFDNFVEEDLDHYFVLAANSRIAEEEAMVNVVTDNDKLLKAFELLENQKIFCRSGYCSTISMAYSCICDEMTEKHKKSIGFCLFHRQDIETVMEAGKLNLAFGGRSEKKNDESSLLVGDLILAALRTSGLNATWNRTIEQRICIEPFVWNRKVTDLLVQCLDVEISKSNKEQGSIKENEEDIGEKREFIDPDCQPGGKNWVPEDVVVGRMKELIKSRLFAVEDKVSIIDWIINSIYCHLTVNQGKAFFKQAADQIIEEESKLPQGITTDNDKLNEVFIKLEEKGIICRHNYDNSMSGATYAIRQEMKSYPNCIGCVFYHSQDTDGAMASGNLNLAFSLNMTEEVKKLKKKAIVAAIENVVTTLVQTLQSVGLDCSWNNNIDERVRVRLKWDRRISDLLKKC